jgi:hypothetical protein
MSRRISIFLLAGVAIAVALFAAHAQLAAGSQWHFTSASIALGTVKKDAAVPVKFQIVNDGAKPIKVVSADGECRCTSLISAPDQIPPHGAATVEFEYSPARDDGPVSKEIHVEAESGDTLDGTFTANVK